MLAMATTGEIQSELREVSRQPAELAAEVARLKQDLAQVREAEHDRERLSPSVPLDGPRPSATLSSQARRTTR